MQCTEEEQKLFRNNTCAAAAARRSVSHSKDGRTGPTDVRQDHGYSRHIHASASRPGRTPAADVSRSRID
ncbi:hypothetical protein EVAR_19359_1 [Eumeta japonica]|uniref:Uncharacterized protein n=1 Tax=Eumeta variegata TaxID=151549 RepID=A0A4C1TRE3_EUMVA|nr:hypothetical protein EVAR_19359_1 [Eumeta japonica]